MMATAVSLSSYTAAVPMISILRSTRASSSSKTTKKRRREKRVSVIGNFSRFGEVVRKDMEFLKKGISRGMEWANETFHIPQVTRTLDDLLWLRNLEDTNTPPIQPRSWPQHYYPELSGVDLLMADLKALEAYASYFYYLSKIWWKPLPEVYDPQDVADYFGCRPHVVALRLLEIRMDERWREAAQRGSIDDLYTLLREAANLLDGIDQVPFIDTPLHIAASAGHTLFAMEMMNLKPSFARKLNPDGFSPMHLALQNGHNQTVLRLLAVDGDLVRVKGRGGVTPLHFAAKEGMVDILAEFLVACPKSIQDLTIRKETALHAAAKNDKVEALEVLLGWLRKVLRREVLNWVDDHDNTILHIAADRNQLEVVRSAMNRDNLNVKNLRGSTALDILENQRQPGNREIINMLRRAGAATASSLPRVNPLADFLKKSSWSEAYKLRAASRRLSKTNEDRSAILVCSVLIATATFHGLINPPGGVRQGNNSPATITHVTTTTPGNGSQSQHYRVGTSVANTNLWLAFTIFNSIAFIASVACIWNQLPANALRFNIILLSILPMMICYGLAILIVTPNLLPIYLVISIFVIASVRFVIVNYRLGFRRKVNSGHRRALLRHWLSFHREMNALEYFTQN